MITHLEPDILEWEVKWALGSITMNKASGGDGIPVELFQILKDDAVKMLHSICQHTERPPQTQQPKQDEKAEKYSAAGKGTGKKERYTHLKAEFQRLAREIRKPSSEINAKK